MVAQRAVRYQARNAAFLQGLQQLGWTEGRNLRVDTRWGAAVADEMRKYAAEFAGLAPDVILAFGANTVGPVLQATRVAPIVFVNVADPDGSGSTDCTGSGCRRGATGGGACEVLCYSCWLFQ